MSKGGKHTDKSWLKTQLEDNKRTVEDIADEVNRSIGAVYYQMRKYDLNTHYPSGKIVNEIGNKYGKLKVVELAGTEGSHAMWVCKHDDGRKVIKKGSDLRMGHATGRYPRREEGEAAFLQLYRSYRSGAKERGLKWSLSQRLFRELTQKNCYYCGAEPYKSMNNRGHQFNGDYIYNGLDRTDNSKGYTKDNVVPCCFQCNKMKGTMDKNEFLEQIYKIKEKRLNK